MHGGLPGGDLTGPRLQDVTHEHVVDLLRGQSRALESGFDRESAELRGGEPRQGAGQLADRRASASDDHGSGHEGPPSEMRNGPVSLRKPPSTHENSPQSSGVEPAVLVDAAAFSTRAKPRRSLTPSLP